MLNIARRLLWYTKQVHRGIFNADQKPVEEASLSRVHGPAIQASKVRHLSATAKVPDALREALGREYKRSLGTHDPDEAKARFAVAWVECERVFALARAQLTGEATYSRADAQQLAARWFRAEQERMDRAADFTSALAADGVVSIVQWAAAGFKDTLLRWNLEPEVGHGNETAVQPGVQA